MPRYRMEMVGRRSEEILRHTPGERITTPRSNERSSGEARRSVEMEQRTSVELDKERLCLRAGGRKSAEIFRRVPQEDSPAGRREGEERRKRRTSRERGASLDMQRVSLDMERGADFTRGARDSISLSNGRKSAEIQRSPGEDSSFRINTHGRKSGEIPGRSSADGLTASPDDFRINTHGRKSNEIFRRAPSDPQDKGGGFRMNTHGRNGERGVERAAVRGREAADDSEPRGLYAKFTSSLRKIRARCF
jgi:hypothetical protein